jgi:hypothetical protein
MAETRKKILCIENDRDASALIPEGLVDRGFDVSMRTMVSKPSQPFWRTSLTSSCAMLTYRSCAASSWRSV